jgi:hypothetical protein
MPQHHPLTSNLPTLLAYNPSFILSTCVHSNNNHYAPVPRFSLSASPNCYCHSHNNRGPVSGFSTYTATTSTTAILIIIEGSKTAFNGFQYQFTTGKPLKIL